MKAKKKHFKYNLILLNESTLEEVFRFKTSRLSFSLLLSAFIIITFTLLSVIIFVTPLKHMLPGYADVSVRSEVIREAQRIDSLELAAYNNDKQLLIIKNIIAGNIEIDSVEAVDSTDIDRWNKLPLTRGESEKKFVEQYEEANAFNINYDMYQVNKEKQMVFAAPSLGSITQHFAPDNGFNGINIVSPANTPILAAQEGNIILEDYNPSKGYTIIIQHEKGFISIYRNIIKNLHHIGSEVKSGEAIAFANSLEFELWLNGVAVNPEDYIVF